jgi:hypothetical protein
MSGGLQLLVDAMLRSMQFQIKFDHQTRLIVALFAHRSVSLKAI